MGDFKVLFSDILSKLVEEFISTEDYAKQLLLGCNDIIIIEKSYQNTDIESNYGIHYIKMSLILEKLQNYKNNINECILGKRKSVYVELDIGTFNRVKFDILELVLECKIVSDNLDVKNKIFHFMNLFIDIDLSNHNNIFVVSNTLDSETYLKYLNKNCKKLCLKTTTDVEISVKNLDELILIYNSEPLFDSHSLNIDININLNKIDELLELSDLLNEKNKQFKELKIHLDGDVDIFIVKKLVNALDSLDGYFEYFKVMSMFEYYYYKKNFYKLDIFDVVNDSNWKVDKNIVSIDDIAFELTF